MLGCSKFSEYLKGRKDGGDELLKGVLEGEWLYDEEHGKWHGMKRDECVGGMYEREREVVKEGRRRRVCVNEAVN